MHAVSEVRILFVAAKIFEWQHRDALVEHTQGRGSRAAQKEKRASENRSQHEQRDCSRDPAHMSAVFLNCCEFAWQLRITHLIGVEVRDAYTHSVFCVECTDIV